MGKPKLSMSGDSFTERLIEELNSYPNQIMRLTGVCCLCGAKTNGYDIVKNYPDLHTRSVCEACHAIPFEKKEKLILSVYQIEKEANRAKRQHMQ